MLYKNPEDSLALFEWNEVRKTRYEQEWYFSLVDVVFVLTDSGDPRQYIKKLKSRDDQLKSKWGTICTQVEMRTKDGKNRLRSRSTIEFLGIWEQINNLHFELVKFNHL